MVWRVIIFLGLFFLGGPFRNACAQESQTSPYITDQNGNRIYKYDQPHHNWNRQAHSPPETFTAALRLRAYQQKLALRAQHASHSKPDAGSGAWTPVGPAPFASDATGNGAQDYNWVSGRATSVLIDPADASGNTVLLGGAYGGLWKSTNAGSLSANPAAVVWQPLINGQPTLSVGAIALQPENSSVILVGTGETNGSADSYYGLGILRSTDGGVTWTQIQSAASGQSFLGVGFSKIAFSTSNPKLVVAATAGDNGACVGLETQAANNGPCLGPEEDGTSNAKLDRGRPFARARSNWIPAECSHQRYANV